MNYSNEGILQWILQMNEWRRLGDDWHGDKGTQPLQSQGAPEDNSGENQTGKENEMVQEHCCEPISSSRNHKAWRSELSCSFMDVVNTDGNPLAACYRTPRRQNVFTSGFVSGSFYSSGLFSVFKQITVYLVKCSGPRLEFKM